MNKTQDETNEIEVKLPENQNRRHPYFQSNSREETIRRMREFPERAAKFLEKLNADREKNAR
jgi:hypothetical protein